MIGNYSFSHKRDLAVYVAGDPAAYKTGATIGQGTFRQGLHWPSRSWTDIRTVSNFSQANTRAKMHGSRRAIDFGPALARTQTLSTVNQVLLLHGAGDKARNTIPIRGSSPSKAQERRMTMMAWLPSPWIASANGNTSGAGNKTPYQPI